MAWAEELGHHEILRFLMTNLNEEKAAKSFDRGLTQVWSLLSTAPGNRGAAHFIWGLPAPD
jgi:hypothetical protein